MVYYDKQTVNGDDIRGFVDLRKATKVQQTSQVRPGVRPRSIIVAVFVW